MHLRHSTSLNPPVATFAEQDLPKLFLSRTLWLALPLLPGTKLVLTPRAVNDSAFLNPSWLIKVIIKMKDIMDTMKTNSCTTSLQDPYVPQCNYHNRDIMTNLLSQHYHEDEAENALLNHPQNTSYSGPFDDNVARVGTPQSHPTPTYSLSETYQTDAHSTSTYPMQNYSGTTLEEPSAAFGVPGRAPSPYSRSETSSTEAWRERQQQNTSGLKRYQTRKVKLTQGSVLSIDYAVPSAIQNSVQKKYREDLEGGSEEFTHMRCRFHILKDQSGGKSYMP